MKPRIRRRFAPAASALLGDWMTPFIGRWERRGEQGELLDTLTFSQPLEEVPALCSTSLAGGPWSGFARPDADERRWRWTMSDPLGTTRELIGSRNLDGGMTFIGRDHSPVGPGLHLRLTYSPQEEGRILKRPRSHGTAGSGACITRRRMFARKSAPSVPGRSRD